MPDWKPEIRRRLANLKLEPTREAAIVEEFAQHLEDCYAESRARRLRGGSVSRGARRAERAPPAGRGTAARRAPAAGVRQALSEVNRDIPVREIRTARAQLEGLLVQERLLATAAVAAYLPVRRATRVDPMVALRDE